MSANIDLNTKLENALQIEFVVADNLREQIYEAIAELNSMTEWPKLQEDQIHEDLHIDSEEVAPVQHDTGSELDISLEDEPGRLLYLP